MKIFDIRPPQRLHSLCYLSLAYPKTRVTTSIFGSASETLRKPQRCWGWLKIQFFKRPPRAKTYLSEFGKTWIVASLVVRQPIQALQIRFVGPFSNIQKNQPMVLVSMVLARNFHFLIFQKIENLIVFDGFNIKRKNRRDFATIVRSCLTKNEILIFFQKIRKFEISS